MLEKNFSQGDQRLFEELLRNLALDARKKDASGDRYVIYELLMILNDPLR